METKKVSLKEQGDWYLFCQSYLYISQLGCVQMLTKGLNQNSLPYGFERNLYLSTLYNFKHSIEIIIKRLYLIGFGERLKNEHNLKSLFEILKEKKNKITPAQIEKMMNNSIKNNLIPINIDYHKDTIDEQVKKFSASYLLFFNELENLVNRYYHLNFINKKACGFFTFSDNKNMAFRYPDKISVQLSYEEILQKIERDDIENLLHDVVMLGATLNTLNIVFQMFTKNNK